MLKSFKYRIYPNNKQKEFLSKQFGCCRFVYNYFLSLQEEKYKNGIKKVSAHQNCKELTILKQQKDFIWLNDVIAQSLQISVQNLEEAYLRFFKGISKFPKQHKKKNSECFKIPQNFRIKNNKLYIPKLKKSGIKVKFHNVLPTKPICCFVSKTPTNKYYVSFLCEVEIPKMEKIDNTIGLDVGINSLIVTSENVIFENKNYYKHLEPKLCYKQRQLSKKRKGSNKRNKARLRLALVHEKITNKRKDFLQKISKKLISENQTIITENLSIKNMVKNHCLAKSIMDVSWGELFHYFRYKSEWYGRTFYQIDRFFPSSKTCNNCQFVKDKLSLKERSWICPKCKTKLDRDLNAAKNIRDKGMKDLTDLSNKDLSVSGTESDTKQKPEEAFSSVSKKKLKKQEKSKKREISEKR